MGCLQQRLRLHTGLGHPVTGVWASWLGFDSPHAVGTGTRQGSLEERQEWVHLRTETGPWGEHLGKLPLCSAGPPQGESVPSQTVRDIPELPCALST